MFHQVVPYSHPPWSPIRHSRDAYAHLMDRRRRRDPCNVRTRKMRDPHHFQAAQLPSLLPEIEPLKSLEEATVALVKHLDKEKDSLKKRLTLSRKSHGSISDLGKGAQDAFEAFGRAFFNNWLSRANVDIKLSQELGPDSLGQTHIPRHIGNPKVLIRLNGPLLSACRKDQNVNFLDQLFSIVLHQMIHAYFLVRCGPPCKSKDPDGRLKHSEHFGTIMYRIKDISMCALGPLPVEGGHSPQPSSHVYNVKDTTAYLLHSRETIRNNDRHHCSECTSEIKHLPQDKLKDWYRNECVKTVNPDIWEFKDSQLKSKPLSEIIEPKSEWIELVWEKKRFKLPRKRVTKITSGFGRKFENENRSVVIPKCDLRTMQALFEFLKDGTYSPSHNDAKCPKGRAPALIMGHIPEWPGLLLQEVNVHKLATVLNFDELRLHALNRLRDQHRTYEDIPAVFAAIYNADEYGRGSVHRELRDWALSFLRRCAEIPTGKRALDYSNWNRLATDVGFQDVRARVRVSSELLDLDCVRAQADLEAVPVKKDEKSKDKEKQSDATALSVVPMPVPQPYPLMVPGMPGVGMGMGYSTPAPAAPPSMAASYAVPLPVQQSLPQQQQERTYAWHPLLGAYPRCLTHCPDRSGGQACCHEIDAVAALWRRHSRARGRRPSPAWALEAGHEI